MRHGLSHSDADITVREAVRDLVQLAQDYGLDRRELEALIGETWGEEEKKEE